MSSAPSGLDARQWAYGYFSYNAPDSTPHVITAQNRWQVTKVQVYAGPDEDVDFVLDAGGGGTGGPPDIIVRKNGCLILEPNGAFRGRVEVTGKGSLTIIEFWWQPTENIDYPVVTVT